MILLLSILIAKGDDHQGSTHTWLRPPDLAWNSAWSARVTASGPAASTVRAALDAWYRQRAREVFADRLTAIAAPLRWVKQLPQTRLQFMTVQWGSCSPSGRITLNPLLVKAPRECIDYVLLHELCHLLHHNHSPKFYRTLDRHMPNWRAVKEKLDNMAEEVFRA